MTEHEVEALVLLAKIKSMGKSLVLISAALAGAETSAQAVQAIVLSGDAPQITPQTIARLLNFHLDQQAAMTLLGADLDHPTGYGRILRKGPRSAEVRAIVEEKSAAPPRRRLARSMRGSMSLRCRNCFRISRSSPPPTPTASITSPIWLRSCAKPGSAWSMEDGKLRGSAGRHTRAGLSGLICECGRASANRSWLRGSPYPYPSRRA